MKLKSLEIHGFKSFADKTVIDFMPGMTGIVGPNGSGKSNIIEAIRWVMGEQSAKGLRGNTMADVIFGGAKNRSALGRASVTMTIDNSDHYLHSAFDELQVSRRLYRNGDAEYLINGVKSRLKDITDLFVDTGLGRESFSIINQGKVEAIFNAKAEDRRAIIEDVAGVFKYKQNKIKSQNELAQTQANLDRLLDIIKEIADRLQPLESQAAEAQQFLSLRSQFDQLNLVKLGRSKKELVANEQAASSQLVEFQNHIKQTETSLNDAGLQQNQANDQSNQLDLQLSDLNHTIELLTQKYEHVLGENNLRKQKRESLQNDLQRLTTEGKQLNQQLVQLTDRLSALDQQVKTGRQKRSESEKAVKAITDQLAKDGQLSRQDQLSDLRNRYVQSMQDAASVSNQLLNLDKEKIRHDARLKSLNNDASQLQQHLLDKKALLTKAANASNEKTDASQLEQHAQQSQSQLNAKKTQLSTFEQQRSSLVMRYNQVQIRLESLQNANENLDLFVGVRNLLANRQQFTGLFGTVAELIKVAPEYALAIETALGAGLQNIVVDKQSTAKQAIDFLTQRRLGRVTFLPVESIKMRFLSANIRSQLTAEQDYVDIAASLVKSEVQYRDIVENLLGTTIITKTLDAAFKISKMLNQHYRVVTIDGHIVNAGGSITGGANRHQSGLLSKRAELDRLTGEFDDLKDRGSKANQLITDLQNEIVADEREFVSLRNTIVAKKEAFQLQAGGQKIAEDALVQTEKQLKANQIEIAELVSNAADAAKLRRDLAAKFGNLQNKNDDLAAQINLLETSLADEQSTAHEQNHQLLLAREKLAAVKVQLQADEKNAAELELAKNKLDENLLQNQKQLFDLNSRLKENDALVLANTAADDIAGQLRSANEKRDQLTKDRQTVSDKKILLQKQIDQLQLTLRQLLDSKNHVDTKLAAIQSHLSELEQDLIDLGRPNFSQLDLLQGEPLSAISSRLAKLKAELSKHNAVNLAAIDELKTVQERYDFLTGQRDDLVAASANLQTAMKQMDQEVVTRFKRTFDAVAEKFKKTFSDLFAGGQASLELSDPKNLLTSGIEIKVQPPGKKLQRLSLLSGGEKALTAIALLLAILLVHPVPFAILDETEAALDESNVDSFGRFLRDFGANTQFIVITHRQGTMRYANVLYGVTMQEPGVSTMVSVDLEKAGKSLEGAK